MTPDDADRIFSSAADGPDPMVSFVHDMRRTYARSPDAATQAKHLRAMAGEFTARPHAPLQRKRRLPVGRAAAAALVGAVLVGGSALAATGHLPGPAQSALSHAAKVVGLTIPSPHDSGKSHGDDGKARAAANKARAKQFTDAKKSWTACVAEKAREHTGPGPFDPEAACGPKPASQDFHPAPTGPTGPDDHGNGKDNGNHGQPATAGHGQGGGNGQAPAHDTVPTPQNSTGHGPGNHGGHTGNG